MRPPAAVHRLAVLARLTGLFDRALVDEDVRLAVPPDVEFETRHRLKQGRVDGLALAGIIVWRYLAPG